MDRELRTVGSDAGLDWSESVGDLLDVALFTLDDEGRLLSWSSRAARRTGWPAESVLGRTLAELGVRIERLPVPDAEQHGRLTLESGAFAGRAIALRWRDGKTGRRGVGALWVAADSGRGAPVWVGRSTAFLEALRRLHRAAVSDVTTLIRGESGTGKELAARAIHHGSARRDGPFVAVHCAAIPGELLESELFGHVRGAFTGAEREHLGYFEQANGGTLFLDEIGELDESVQIKLLRALETREVRPVGADRGRPVDVRLVSATHRDLAELLSAGHLREDFYYRVRVFEVHLPPLRERRGDVLELARHFLEELARRNARPVPMLEPGAERALEAHDWPGNVRELRNAVEHAFVVAENDAIGARDLPVEVGRSLGSDAGKVGGLGLPAGSEAEREQLRVALEAHGWNRTRTAESLGISRVTLWKKIRQHRLDDGTFRGVHR